ncbi:MAG: hypothetical protein ACI8YO_001684, partial [Gammaproteobacteria bacterium]
DNDACTTDSCDPATGCVNSPIDCDDNDACTTDSCDSATGCVNTTVDCDDGDACTTDSCDPATGCVNTTVDCDDGDACTTDSCDPATGCVNTAIDCDDGNACTADSCDPATGCVNTAIDCSDCPLLGLNIGDACDDGNSETEGDVVGFDCICTGIDPCPSPVNDESAGALMNTANNIWGVPGWDTFDVACATLSRESCDGSIPLADTWYSFVAQAENQGILVRANPSDPIAAISDMAVELYDATPNPLSGLGGGNCVVSRSCFNNYGDGQIERCVPSGLTIGDTYYYRVYDANGGDVTIVDTKVKTYADHTILDGCIIIDPIDFSYEWTIVAPIALYNIPPVPVFNVRMVIKDLSGSVVAMTPSHDPSTAGELTFNFGEFATALGAGNYTIHAQNEVKMHANGCVSAFWSQTGTGCALGIGTTAIAFNFTEGTADLNLNFTAYPNPNAGDQAYIKFDQVIDTNQDVIVEIFNMYGKKVHSEQFANAGSDINRMITFDQKLTSGMYFINLSVNETIMIEKLIIE